MPKLRQDLVDRANTVIENFTVPLAMRELMTELRDNLRDAPPPAPPPKKRAPAVGAVKKRRVVTKSKSGKKIIKVTRGR